MTINKNIREIAHDILMKIEYDHGYSDELVNYYKDKKIINDIRDFNLLRRIVLGVLERKISLDYIIKKSSKTKFNKIDKKIIMLLRIAIYQMLYLTQVPDHASINLAVDHSKKLLKWNISGFVNGVLRNISRNKEKLLDMIDKSDDLSVRYNLPDDIIKYLLNSYGDKAHDLMMSFYNQPKMSIRVNIKKKSLDAVYDELLNMDIKVTKSNLISSNLLIDDPIEIHKIELYKNGIISIQGEGSSLAVQALNLKEDSKVLDLCAAPGTKSVQIAENIGDKGFIIVNDINKSKIDKIKENFSRINFNSYIIKSFDATEKNFDFIETFDYVLVDAPCSALGLISRKPEIRYRRNLKDINLLKDMQRKILNNAISYLKPGGTLVYSTCTYGELENKDQYEFLKSNKEMVEESFVFKNKKYTNLQLFNNNDNTDGFYICKFKKINL